MSKYIAPYILRSEYACKCCEKLPPDFLKEREISCEYILLFETFRQVREEYGHKLPISRGYSCCDHQMKLYLTSKADSPYSVHIFGLALDIVPPKQDIESVVKIFKIISPDLRIGWKKYQNNLTPHLHIDIGYLIIPRWSLNLTKGVRW